MRRVGWGVLFALAAAMAGPLGAAVPGPAAAGADPLAGSRRIDEALRELKESTPAAKEMNELSEQIGSLDAENRKKTDPLQQAAQKLYERDDYKAYREKVRVLESQRQDKWELERKVIAGAAKELYEARHGELRKIAPAALPKGKALGFDVLSFPRIDGSTSTHPLNVIMASRLLNIPYEWVYPEPTGSPWQGRGGGTENLFLPDNMRASAGLYRPEDYELTLAASQVVAKPAVGASAAQERIAMMINSLLAASSNTHVAYVNLIEGKCDLNINARAPSESELKLATEKGVKIALKAIAMDALVFIVNHENPVKSLTLQQVRDIYEDKSKEWKDVAGDTKLPEEWKTGKDKKAIAALRRDRDSGSRELFDGLVMQGKQLPESTSKGDVYTGSMSGPYNRVTQEARALAYSVYYYEHFMALSPFTRTLAIDGVEPSAETIGSGKYPLTAPVYAAYRESDPADSPGRKLLDWLVSAEGQAVVRESGYVGVK